MESESWKSYVVIVETFLVNHKVPNYEETVQNMLTDVLPLEASMSMNLDYVRNHLD